MESLDFGESSPAGSTTSPTSASASPLLRGLNPEQVAAVTAESDRLCILAGAGSGKTRVLTRRIAYRSNIGAIDPRRVLALTFTRKAASELTKRLRQLGLRDDVSAGTFHGVAYAQLRARAAERGGKEPKLLDRKTGFVAKLVSRSDERTKPIDVVTEIEWAKARLITPERYEAAVKAAGREAPVEPGRIAALFRDYEDRKAKMGLVDFDDLLGITAHEMRRDKRWGDAQRWRFRHLFVDEFQDVNPLQFSLLKSWLGSEADLCVVGDPRQAIYGWNGADSGYITDFGSHFGGAQTLTLRRNHRSTPQILAAANAVLDTDLANLEPLIATRNPGPAPTVTGYETDDLESAAIARAVRDAHTPGGRWSDQAILTRTNGQLAGIEAALRAANVPFRARSGNDFLELPDVKRAFDDLAHSRDLRSAIADLEADLAAAAIELEIGTDEYSDEFDVPSEQQAALRTAELNRQMNIGALIDLGREFLQLDPDGPGSRFAGWLHTAIGSDRSGSITDAVELSTFHGAKGLEWPVVHLAGLEEGFVPLAFARSAQARREERNLLHVAITRAERQVHCTWAMLRSFGATTIERGPSPYLPAMTDAATVDQRNSQAAPEAKASLANVRNVLTGEVIDLRDSVAPDLVARREALTEWRSTMARASAVAPAAIIGDRLLDEIASAAPASIDDLIELGMPEVRARRFGPAIVTTIASSDRA